ncbi:MAG: hypothetical protein QNK20_01740 [Aureibaculum sp.]|nr:hypothetical protein [Aureibaculum sp.]
MPKIELQINGEKLLFYDSFNFSDQINTISASVSFSSFVNYDAFDYAEVKVFRDSVLIFTGEIIDKSIPTDIPIKPFTYKAESTTHILSECTLPTESYPLQLENLTLKDIVEYICSFFEVTVIFDQSAEKEANGKYKLSDLKLGENAASIINDLVTESLLILSHNSYGNLVITKEIAQKEVLLPYFISNKKSFDLKKFYHNYIAIGQAPIGQSNDIQAIASFSNIDSRRNTTKIQNKGGIDTIENKAEGMRLDSLKSITHGLTFNNFFCNIGDFVFIDSLKLVINQINYSYNTGGEIASISIVDSKIYER